MSEGHDLACRFMGPDRYWRHMREEYPRLKLLAARTPEQAKREGRRRRRAAREALLDLIGEEVEAAARRVLAEEGPELIRVVVAELRGRR